MVELTVKDGIILGFGFIIAQIIVSTPIAILHISTGYQTQREVLVEIRDILKNNWKK